MYVVPKTSSIAKQEDKTAKLSKSKLEINNLWEEKQEAEKMWIEAIEKEEAEQRERRVEYFKLNATLVENQAKQIIKAETLQFFHNVMKFKSELLFHTSQSTYTHTHTHTHTHQPIHTHTHSRTHKNHTHTA